jgi:DNA invertase Pin-like site-specific DNA recombinase
MTTIGYGRCSTKDQNTDDQRARLIAAGCDADHLFIDEGVSGKHASRPEWDKCMTYLRTGDTLCITKLDRAGRSVKHLLEMSAELSERGVALRILDQGIDTSTAVGRMFYTILGALAEFERELIVERTHEGLRTAREKGHKSGRKPKLSEKQQAEVRRMHADGRTIVDIAEMFGVSRPVIYRVLEAAPATA